MGNIKLFLLDIYFYQAVHFKRIERIAETGGGYFREVIEQDLDIQFSFDPDAPVDNDVKPSTMSLFNVNFHREVQTQEIKVFEKDQRRGMISGLTANRDQALLKILKLEL